MKKIRDRAGNIISSPEGVLGFDKCPIDYHVFKDMSDLEFRELVQDAFRGIDDIKGEVSDYLGSCEKAEVKKDANDVFDNLRIKLEELSEDMEAWGENALLVEQIDKAVEVMKVQRVLLEGKVAVLSDKQRYSVLNKLTLICGMWQRPLEEIIYDDTEKSTDVVQSLIHLWIERIKVWDIAQTEYQFQLTFGGYFKQGKRSLRIFVNSAQETRFLSVYDIMKERFIEIYLDPGECCTAEFVGETMVSCRSARTCCANGCAYYLRWNMEEQMLAVRREGATEDYAESNLSTIAMGFDGILYGIVGGRITHTEWMDDTLMFTDLIKKESASFVQLYSAGSVFAAMTEDGRLYVNSAPYVSKEQPYLEGVAAVVESQGEGLYVIMADDTMIQKPNMPGLTRDQLLEKMFGGNGN